ncbi:MAG: LytTR family DNA-binding domain-containing protein [Gemmatimonadota bacterium]
MRDAEGFGVARVLICEDEPLAVRALREYLKDVDWIEIVGEARTGSDAVRLIQKLEPDLVFLDVRMPGLTGLEVLETITHHTAIIFTTAYDEYALSAFEFGALDYLVKPFGKVRLMESLDRVRVRLVGEGMAGRASKHGRDSYFAARLFARHRGGIVPISVEQIIRIDAISGGVSLVTDGTTFSSDASLAEIQERLNPKEFLRVHRGHIVNLSHVSKIEKYDERRFLIRLDDGSRLVASRRGSQALRELMD